MIAHSCDSSHSFPPIRSSNVSVGEWVKSDDRSFDRVRCSDCNRIYRVPTAFDLSTTMVRMDVGWEILSVLTPVVCVSLLGLIVLYALSRAPRRPQ